MSREWTAAQKTAISLRGKDLLISAAAGSGKTATLTERIIRSLTDKESPSDISKLLVVTFTRAAATELKQRIFSAVSEAIAEDPSNKHLSSQLVKIPNAKICTIDSFYLDLIRENFSLLGLPPSFRIADTAEGDLLARDIMEDTINEFYDSESDFAHVAESFSTIKGRSRLADVFLTLYSDLLSYPEGVDYMNKCAKSYEEHSNDDFLSTAFGKVLKDQVKDGVEHFIILLDDITDKVTSDDEFNTAYGGSCSYDKVFCHALKNILDASDYTAVRDHLSGFSPIKAKAYKGADKEFAEQVKKIRGDFAKFVRGLKEKEFGLPHESIARAMSESGVICLALYRLLCSFDEKFSQEKLSRGICDFSDVRRYALKLLVNDGAPTPLAESISQKYTDIYIDEYQDVDRVQDMIFSAISNGHNRFMVGDIKQSIYGFRGAEPRVFAHYRSSFSECKAAENDDESGVSIFMSNNFRCDENIIKFTNTVCSYLFGICSDSSVYTREDDLIFSKPLPYDEYTSPKVTVGIVTAPEDDDSDYESNSNNNKLSEARYVASKILQLLHSGAKADGTPIRAGDIAVLIRSSSMKPFIKQAFDEAGIDFCGETESNFFNDPEVLLVLSVLNVIDNPHRDIYLAGALHSPLFSFSLDELVALRNDCDPSFSLYDTVVECANDNSSDLSQKCAKFVDTLSSWRTVSLSLSTDKLLGRIYSSREFTALGLSSSDKLRTLYEYARRFESGTFKGLYNFLEYINKLIEQGKQPESANGDSSPDKVSIMTVHHSKGLEFPVCFLCGTSGEFNRSDSKESLLLEYETGVAMKLSDDTGFARINTPMRAAVASKTLSDQTEEEMRVLYVALTRAREFLYVTGNSSKTEERIMYEAISRAEVSDKYTVLKCKSYLEWILTALAGKDIFDICDIEFIPADTVTIWNEKSDIITSTSLPDIASDDCISDEKVSELSEKLSFKYPFGAMSRIPAKISVSRLSPDILDENDTTLNLFESPKISAVPNILLGNATKELTSADRGTMTHLFFQFCDFALAEKGVKEELSRLIELRFLPSYAADCVFTDELEGFFKSELYEKIKHAKKIIREQRFNILLPPSMFSKNEEFIDQVGDELMAVQGVIDLIIIGENDELYLYDYKTDRLSSAERSSISLLKDKMYSRHSEQLSYYKIAVERLFDRECTAVGIYSTHAAKLVEW